MRVRTGHTVTLLLCGLWWAAQGPAAKAQESASPPAPTGAEAVIAADVASLAAAGIRDDAESVIRFLTEGFTQQTDLSKLPPRPAVRSQLFVAAMRVAAVRQYRMAGPALVWIAQGDFGPGIERVIRYDARNRYSPFPGAAREQFEATLRSNAINALGLLGDLENLPALARLFKAERDPVRRVAIALAQAGSGDPEAVEYLVEQAKAKDRAVVSEACEALSWISGRDFVVSVRSSAARRKAVAADIQKWWKQARKTFVPDPQAIRQRRFEPPAPRALPVPPRGIADLLVLAVNENNATGAYSNLEAFRRIVDTGAGALGPLSAVIADEMADIDVRLLSMRACESIVKNRNVAITDALLEALAGAARGDDPEVRAAAARLRDELKAILKSRQ